MRKILMQNLWPPPLFSGIENNFGIEPFRVNTMCIRQTLVLARSDRGCQGRVRMRLGNSRNFGGQILRTKRPYKINADLMDRGSLEFETLLLVEFLDYN